MPKRTITTVVGAQFDVSEGTVTIGTEEKAARILHVFDGGDRTDIVMEVEAALALADALRADGIVIPKPQIVPIHGTKGRR